MVIILKRHKKKNRFFKIAYISAFTGISAIFLFLIFFTVLSLLVDFSETVYRLSAIFLLITGTFVSGWTGSFLNRCKGFKKGMISCAPVITVVLLISCLSGSEETVFGVIRGILLGLISGGTGGIIGVNSKMSIGKYKMINIFLHDT